MNDGVDEVRWIGLDPGEAGHAGAGESAGPALIDGECFELLAAGARGVAARFLRLEDGPSTTVRFEEDRDLLERWAARYRRVTSLVRTEAPPYAIYFVGVDPPPDASPTELEQFAKFYSNVHLPEVAERRRCLRATRYELIEELSATPIGVPKNLAVYEVDERGSHLRRHIGGPYARGPEVWQRHTTPWRHWYRRIDD